MKINDIVKFINPDRGEVGLHFTVISNPHDNKVQIEPVLWNYAIKPIELVDIDEITPV